MSVENGTNGNSVIHRNDRLQYRESAAGEGRK
jgi:hypothetical protein